MQPCLDVRYGLLHLLDLVDVGEGFQVIYLVVFERIDSLNAKSRAVYEKQYASEAVRLNEAIAQADNGSGFSGACGHSEQHPPWIGLSKEYFLYSLNCFDLVCAEAQPGATSQRIRCMGF